MQRDSTSTGACSALPLLSRCIAAAANRPAAWRPGGPASVSILVDINPVDVNPTDVNLKFPRLWPTERHPLRFFQTSDCLRPLALSPHAAPRFSAYALR